MVALLDVGVPRWCRPMSPIVSRVAGATTTTVAELDVRVMKVLNER